MNGKKKKKDTKTVRGQELRDEQEVVRGLTVRRPQESTGHKTEGSPYALSLTVVVISWSRGSKNYAHRAVCEVSVTSPSHLPNKDLPNKNQST